MSRTMQQVKAARAVRGRKWDQEAERCATCAHHVATVSEMPRNERPISEESCRDEVRKYLID